MRIWQTVFSSSAVSKPWQGSRSALKHSLATAFKLSSALAKTPLPAEFQRAASWEWVRLGEITTVAHPGKSESGRFTSHFIHQFWAGPSTMTAATLASKRVSEPEKHALRWRAASLVNDAKWTVARAAQHLGKSVTFVRTWARRAASDGNVKDQSRSGRPH